MPKNTDRQTSLKAKFFRGFSDPSRLAILNALRDGPRSVTEIVSKTGFSQSKVSNHLSCLRECGLVSAKQSGRFVHYRLSNKSISRILDVSDRLILEIAENISECNRYHGKE